MHTKLTLIAIAVAGTAIIGAGGYVMTFEDRILPHVHVGDVPLGALTREEALARMSAHLTDLEQRGIALDIEGKRDMVRLEAIGFSASPDVLVERAWQRGRGGSLLSRIVAWVTSPFLPYRTEADVALDRDHLINELVALSEIIDDPRRDIRFQITGTKIGILYDTKPGRVLNKEQAADRIIETVQNLSKDIVLLTLEEDIPRASLDSVPQAMREAEQMMRDSLILRDERYHTVVDRARIGSWIISSYEGDKLVPALDTRAMSHYMTGIAEYTDVAPQKPRLTVVDGKVTDFVPPRTGRSLEQGKAITTIADILAERRQGKSSDRELRLPVKTTRASSQDILGYEGITELIGTATTPFTGSPANRISNIKNGVRFLTGVIVPPGEEFSTLKTLGTIDNTTGYLPELVIKGDRTTPEFGGGLCQVSTTLFRAVMNASLPVTARRNHSFRISYYEKAGDGTYIGPGLDATIYEPDLDFKFKNDSESAVLIYGYVVGDRITFELYGTSDGRKSALKGPTLFNEVPPGDPIYVDTDTLPKGTIKQVEIPHPGGTTVATYTITYPDGRTVDQEFKSYYRRWPARYLVGTKE